MTAIKQISTITCATIVLMILGCRRVDSSSSSTMATKPSELFSTDAKKRCLERASQLSLTSVQQSALCEIASSSAPVDCFKKKSAQGGSPDGIITSCKSAR